MTEHENLSFHTWTFRAMNTTIEAVLLQTEASFEHTRPFVVNGFRRSEERFSRFRDSSELSNLNRLSGDLCLVSGGMTEVLTLAEKFRIDTEGTFDPLILPALLAAGYDRSYERIGGGAQDPKTAMNHPARPEGRIQLNASMRSLRLPEHGALDLGGIVKSWTVMRLAGALKQDYGIRTGMINAGGDLTVWDDASALAEPWNVEIAHPASPDGMLGSLMLPHGSAATSSTLGRRWGTKSHHLIDPRTMQPSESDITQATVTGPDAVVCEIWAKTLCILGTERGIPLFSRRTRGYEALLYTTDGRTLLAGEAGSLGKRWRGMTVDDSCILYPEHDWKGKDSHG